MTSQVERTSPLKALPANERKKLEERWEIMRFHKGQLIFEEGDAAESVWIVKRGWVYLMKRTPQGGLTTIFTMTPDEALCGISAFDRGTYSARAVAAVDCQMIKIPAETFSQLLERYPEFAKHMIFVCSTRIRRMAETISLAQASVEQRVAYALLRLRASFGNVVPIIHQELARMAHTRLETSIRVVSNLRRRGWLKTSRGKVHILRPQRLEALLTNQDEQSFSRAAKTGKLAH